MASETLADVVAEMRELAADIEAGNAVVGQTVWRNYAYRIEEAAKRSKYERLHECFWDKRAVQCVVRQMLDERDDLSGIDPVSANRMEYFANQLIGAASDGKSFGNAAAMREALAALVAYWDWNGFDAMRESRLKDMARAALSAPPRNCDVGTEQEQEVRFEAFCHAHRSRERGCEDCPIVADRASCEFTWAQMPYEKGGEK